MEQVDFEPAPGMRITPSLQLIRRLGGGGMGAVWLARHEGLATRVVVKFIARSIASSPGSTARFRREAAAAAQVRSPHVVQMLDYGVTEEGAPYLVMELLEGNDLAHHLAKVGALPAHEVIAIVRQLCKALSRAHELGIIHRDIKPENVFLCDTDDDEPFVKLLDFGIAKGTHLQDVTNTGSAVGTPCYMSPEQTTGSKALDHRSDLWSLGVLTFLMLTGRLPFEGTTAGAITLAVCTGPIPKPTNYGLDLPPAIDDWFLKACARDPDARYTDARTMARALTDALFGDVTRNIIDMSALDLPGPERARGDSWQGKATLESAPRVGLAATLESAPRVEAAIAAVQGKSWGGAAAMTIQLPSGEGHALALGAPPQTPRSAPRAASSDSHRGPPDLRHQTAGGVAKAVSSSAPQRGLRALLWGGAIVAPALLTVLAVVAWSAARPITVVGTTAAAPIEPLGAAVAASPTIAPIAMGVAVPPATRPVVVPSALATPPVSSGASVDEPPRTHGASEPSLGGQLGASTVLVPTSPPSSMPSTVGLPKGSDGAPHRASTAHAERDALKPAVSRAVRPSTDTPTTRQADELPELK